jgi:hypothetical protein
MSDDSALLPHQEGSSSTSQSTLSAEIQSFIGVAIAKALASSMGGRMSPETKTQDDQKLEDDATKSKSDVITKPSDPKSIESDTEYLNIPEAKHKHNDTLAFDDSIFKLTYELSNMHPKAKFHIVRNSSNRFVKELSKLEQGEKRTMEELLSLARDKTLEQIGGTRSDRRYIIDNNNFYRGLASAFGNCKNAASAIVTAEIGNGHMLYNLLKAAIVPPEKSSIVKILAEMINMVQGEKETAAQLQQRLYLLFPMVDEFLRKSNANDLFKLVYVLQAVNAPELRYRYTAEDIIKKEIGDLVLEASHIIQTKSKTGTYTARPHEINAVRFDRTNRSRLSPNFRRSLSRQNSNGNNTNSVGTSGGVQRCTFCHRDNHTVDKCRCKMQYEQGTGSNKKRERSADTRSSPSNRTSKYQRKVNNLVVAGDQGLGVNRVSSQ